jgi:hypothetical protein
MTQLDTLKHDYDMILRLLHLNLVFYFPPGGPPSIFLSVDDGRSQISGSTSQGAHHRRF